MKKELVFTLMIAMFCMINANSQQAFKLNIKQDPLLKIAMYDEIIANKGDIIDLDTLFQIEGDIYIDRKWEFGDGIITQDIINPQYSLTSDGTFYLTITDENGCEYSYSISLSLITGFGSINSDQENGKNIRVFPNPNTGNFNLRITDCQSDCSYQIVNLLGVQMIKEYLECTLNEYSGKIVMPNTESGLYFLLVTKDNKIIGKQKVIIQN